MAFNFKYARYSAICHFTLGFLCIVFGIADRATMYKRHAFHSEGVIAIWTGIWFLITGFLGYFASQSNPVNEGPKIPMVLKWRASVFSILVVSTYLSFSIVSSVFAVVIIICYSIGIAIILEGESCSDHVRYSRNQPGRYRSEPWYRISEAKECTTSVGLAAMIIMFAVAEFGIGIWSAVCCCMAYNGCCCVTSPQQTQQGQVVYFQTQGGPVATYVMTQGPNGIPVAVPAMNAGPAYMVQNQPGGGQVYLQNPQGTTAVPGQPGGQVYLQNPQGTTAVPGQPGGRVYIQNPQGATAVPGQPGGRVYIQNPQGATALPAQQQVVYPAPSNANTTTTSAAQQQFVTAQRTEISYDFPPQKV